MMKLFKVIRVDNKVVATFTAEKIEMYPGRNAFALIDLNGEPVGSVSLNVDMRLEPVGGIK